MNKFFRTMLTLLLARRRPKLGILDVGRMTLRVRPTDLDVLRHMNNGVYLSIADLGRFDLLVRSGVWRTFQERGWYPVVANLTISYRKSLNPWQLYDLETRMAGADAKSVFIEQRFVVAGEIYARMFVRGRFLKRSGGVVSLEEIGEAVGVDLAALEAPGWLTHWSENVALPSTREPAPSSWN